MNRLVVYTAIFNNYDTLKEPAFKNNSIDFICFTDNKKLKSKIWKIKHYKNEKYSPSQNNRHLKILGPYSELKDYDYSIYVDGSIRIKKDPIELFERFKGFEMMSFKHYARNCLYREIEQCLLENRGNKIDLFRQGLAYQKEGMPENFSLSDNTVVFRNHTSAKVKNAMGFWWNEVSKYSGRDQVSLPYVLWKSNLQYTFFENTLLESIFFEVGPHRHEYLRRFWRFSKNLLIKNK